MENKNQIVICKECKNVKNSEDFRTNRWRCKASKEINFISGQETISYCNDINKKGNCELFQQLTMEEKLTKELNETKRQEEFSKEQYLKFLELFNKNFKEIQQLSQMNLIEFYNWKKKFILNNFDK
jgi:type II secretory ATPase GspE/PulE/Tfp pilus assembly ATPase PilB-like protein